MGVSKLVGVAAQIRVWTAAMTTDIPTVLLRAADLLTVCPTCGRASETDFYTAILHAADSDLHQAVAAEKAFENWLGLPPSEMDDWLVTGRWTHALRQAAGSMGTPDA